VTAALLYTLGVVIFVVAILVSIGLHELGHMIPAKRFGGKVTQYFIGFGPTVWSRQVGETEYGVKAIPLGGYVKIVGMLPPGADELDEDREHPVYDEDGNRVVRLRRSNTGMFTQLISDARAAEWEHIRPGDENRLFYKLAWWKKVVVMAGGPTVNILIAFFLFWMVFATYGQKTVEPDAGQPVIDSVSVCVLPYEESGRECTPEDPPAPAYEAGLRPGDVVTSFNGTPVTDWDQLRDLIRGNDDGEAVIGFERDGEPMTGTTNTTVEARPQSAEDLTLREVGFLGVTPTSHVETTTGGPVFTLREMGGMTVDTVKALGTLPVKVWGVAKAIVGVEERAADSPVSIVGGGRIAGEVSAHETFPVTEKAVFLVMLVAGFNFFIGMFNFIPLLPLDGGHIAGALWEALRRGVARLRGRPDPGYVDVAKLLPIAYVVASAILVMGVVLIVGDLVVPIHVLA
jgi:membrane-associated protease RseP (regulator of RpoE activity)